MKLDSGAIGQIVRDPGVAAVTSYNLSPLQANLQTSEPEQRRLAVRIISDAISIDRCKHQSRTDPLTAVYRCHRLRWHAMIVDDFRTRHRYKYDPRGCIEDGIRYRIRVILR